MALPNGVTVATVTFGTDADVLGVGATTTLTITPSHTLIWAATGEIIRAFSVSVDAAAGVVGSFAIPHTDQAGFTDELGQAITNWYYTVAGLVARDGETQPYRKVFQVASGVTSLNLDLIPINGTVSAVGIAPQPGVLSVVGQTGPVTADQIFAAIEPELSTTIAEGIAPVQVRSRNTFTTLGDSIMKGDADLSVSNYKDDFGTWLTVLSGGEVRYVGGFGVAGETTAQIFARVASALAANPGFVHVSAGTNNVREYVIGAKSGADESDVLDDVFSVTTGIPAIVAAIKAAGAIPSLQGLPPRGNPGSDLTTDQLAKWRRLVRRVNLRMENYARAEQIPYTDIYSVLVEPTTGAYKTAYAHASGTDGTHPNAAGVAKNALTVWNGIQDIVPALAPALVSDTADVTGVFTTNQLFGTTQSGGGGTTPGSWSTVGTYDATAVPSCPADASGFGNRFRVTRSGGAGGVGISRTFTAVAGRRYRFRFAFKTTGLRILPQIYRDAANWLRVDLGAGTYWDEGVGDFIFTPATGGSTTVQLWVYPGSGFAEFWRVSVVDETALELEAI